ncbi:MAG: prepilin-type N-terminal cleavage/methylation domain-containing protein [Lachnospiraceae bacterium]|nr:prepilin-type N-terminal cleavage/methylation domain-containing protein [Lachnospiraceae bacterium]
MTKELTQDSRGFSLVELIVVIAIMSVVSAGVLMSMSVVTGQNIKSCYAQLDSNIENARLLAMSKNNVTIKLYAKANGEVYIKLSNATDEVRIGKRGLSVRYMTNTGVQDATEAAPLELAFDRSTGAFKPLNGTTDVYCQKIILSDGKRTFTMRLVPKTGKIYRE